MKKFLLISGLAGATVFAAQAALYVTNWNDGFANGSVVPDNNYSGWTDTRTVNAIPAGTLQSVNVTLDLVGGWNGDLFAYLVHDAGYALLFDRVGYPASAYGYGDTGFDITLSATGNPIESYQSFSPTFNVAGQLEGTWQAQSGLGSFAGLNPSGTWTLFVADLSGGSVTTVESWGLQMDITAVPEPTTWAALIFGGGLAGFYLVRTHPARRRIQRWKAAVNEWLDAA